MKNKAFYQFDIKDLYIRKETKTLLTNNEKIT